MKFQDRRRTIKALQDFRPGMEEDDKSVPVEILLVAFFAIIGMMTSVYGLGVALIEIMKLLR